jgi:hypothetical protein
MRLEWSSTKIGNVIMDEAPGYADVLAVRLSPELIATGEAWLAGTPGGTPEEPSEYVGILLHAIGYAADEQAEQNGQHSACLAGAYEMACFGRKHAFGRLYETGIFAALAQSHDPAAFKGALARTAGAAPLYFRRGGVFEFVPCEFLEVLERELSGAPSIS